MVQNPNAPLFDEAVSFPNGPNNTAPFNYWCSVKSRTEGQWSATRGRQYEIDQIQTGTVQSTLRNDDGVLDPSNSAGPFYPQITPYRGYRRRAQLPATVNLLTADQATASKASLGLITSSTLPQWVLAGAYGTTIANNGTINYYTVALPANPTAQGLIQMTGFSVAPSTAYSVQCQANGSTGLSVQLVIWWYNAAGTLISSSSGTAVAMSAATVTLSVSGTAPANAAGALFFATNTTNPVGAASFNSWNYQIEQNTSISSWVQPGTWYDMFTGFVERWPQRWTDGGTYGLTDLTCVDAFGYLSQHPLKSPAYMEALTLAPTFLYPLDEPSTSSNAIDLTNNRAPATIAIGTFPLRGSSVIFQDLAFGGSIQTAGGQQPYGLSGPVLTATNPNITTGVADRYLDLTGRGVNRSGPLTATGWTRCLAFYAPPAPASANSGVQLFYMQDAANSATHIVLNAQYDANGHLGNGTNFFYVDFVNNGVETGALRASPVDLSDGGWHFIVWGISNSTTAFGWLDGVAMTFIPVGTLPTLSGAGTDVLCGAAFVTGGATPGPLGGQYALAAEFPTVLTSAQAALLYSAVMFAGSGTGTATSASRFADVLRWARWAGQSAIDSFTTGQTQTYGPSSDLNASASQPGTDSVSALQTVTDSEDGEQFVNKSGAITFFARQRRMNKGTPKVTFGENTAGGEIPYTDCSFGLDPTRLANDAQITQTMTSTATRVLNQTSINTYGDVQIQRTVNDTTKLGINDMATRLANHFATPVQRLETLTIEPATFTNAGAPSTAAWAACLSLELGDLVQINRRPPNAPLLSFSGFVEQIRWKIDDQGNATCDLQVSPNYGNQYWQLDSATYSVLGSTTILGY